VTPDPGERHRFLIAGAGGMLGTALVEALAERGVQAFAPPEDAFDITDPDVVAHVLRVLAEASDTPGVLLNAAAYTNVEGAEDEPDLAYLVNETGPKLLAEAAAARGVRFVHVSTDFVFDGEKGAPYVETDEPNPLSVYGASKLAGERAVLAADPSALVVRTAWSYYERGVNFPRKILDLAARQGEFTVVTDETGSPTYIPDLARGIIGLVDADARGVLHLAGAGACSRFELATELLRLVGSEASVVPTTTASFPTKARRPRDAALDCDKAAALGVVMPAWQDGLARFAERVGATTVPCEREASSMGTGDGSKS
jgi:dTDP-4-dehydrorhamnose reductase